MQDNTIKTVIAFAGEDDRYHAVSDYAAEIAEGEGARLILYDIDAAGLQAPLPTTWSAEGTEEHFANGLLTAEMLEGLGRHELARQVAVHAAKGLQAFGWLPERAQVDALIEYAEAHEASVIVVPARSDHRALLDLLRGRDTEQVAERTKISVAVVDEEKGVAVH